VFCWRPYFFTCKNSPKIITNHTSCHPNTQTPPPNTMACSSLLGCHHIPINLEWAESLVGLWLIIPNSWWLAYNDDGFNLGRIAAINLDKPWAYYFQVQLDDNYYLYGMLYKLSSFTWTAISLASHNSIFRHVFLAISTTKWCKQACHCIDQICIDQIRTWAPHPAHLVQWALPRTVWMTPTTRMTPTTTATIMTILGTWRRRERQRQQKRKRVRQQQKRWQRQQQQRRRVGRDATIRAGTSKRLKWGRMFTYATAT
jgi:hypothetical protein